MSAAALAVEDVSVEFGGVVALGDVSLRLELGQSLGLIGPNGAGKSTLVNVFTGFQPVARGRVFLDGEEVTGMAPYKFPRRGIVRTFQSTRVYDQLSVYENVEVAALGKLRSRAAARQRAEELLVSTGLWGYRYLTAASMPTGHAHLLGIARALALAPRFLLLDEPAAGLNDRESRELVETLRRIVADRDLGLLLIEHNMDVVTGVCGRIHVIHEGRTLAEGTPKEVGSDPRVLEAYLGKKGFEDAVDN